MNVIELIGRILYGKEDFNLTMENDAGITRQRVARLRSGDVMAQGEIYLLKGFCLDKAGEFEKKAKELREIAAALTNGAPKP